MRAGIWQLLLSAVLVATFSSRVGAMAHLSETGSTLLYPILTVWIQRFSTTHPDVRIDAAPTGSGVGIASAMSGSAQIGGSDAYLSDAQMKAKDVLNIPLAVSAQEIAYNLPELRGGASLRLSGPVLAGMYDGTIAMWDDAKIRELNHGLTLPHRAIVPLHRNDGSGDTFLFTQYLSLSTPSWERTIHFGTRVRWPENARAIEADGNAGAIDAASRTAYSVAYVGISFADRARAAGLGVAAIRNRSGAFVLPTTEATLATAQKLANAAPEDGRLSMIYTTGADAYPLVNFEYAIVKPDQGTPGSAAALRDFLNWVVTADEGNDAALLGTVHFAPLPDPVRAVARREIATIVGP